MRSRRRSISLASLLSGVKEGVTPVGRLSEVRPCIPGQLMGVARRDFASARIASEMDTVVRRLGAFSTSSQPEKPGNGATV